MARIKLTRKRTLIIVAVIGLLVIGGVTAAYTGLFPSIYVQKEQPGETVAVEDVQQVALEFANNNDVDGGLKYFDETIEKTQSDDGKKSLLLAKSNFALGQERIDVAVSAAEQANKISSDIASTEALARTYAANGDKEKALVYYKKVLELSTAEGSSDRYTPIWEEKIAELER